MKTLLLTILLAPLVLLVMSIPSWPLWAIGALAAVLWAIVIGTHLNIHDMKRTPPGE